MGPIVVVERLSLPEPLLQVEVAFIAEELVALLLIRAMQALHLAVELRRARLLETWRIPRSATCQ